ncbi:Ntn hydrolase family protein [Flavobacterium rhizosphaerae]|uniref:Uncharacterized protein n=1 Tax=Flavobacterium rhizosphaerae TaxID=3163298 RepID=A0ABW8YZI4_9FLAO
MDKRQTPAPKVSSENKMDEKDKGTLKEHMEVAKKGAAKQTDATKTPEKIQEGDLSKDKTEY